MSATHTHAHAQDHAPQTAVVAAHQTPPSTGREGGCDAGWIELVVVKAALRDVDGVVFSERDEVVELVAPAAALARLAVIGDVHGDVENSCDSDEEAWDDGVWADDALAMIQAEIERAWGESDALSFSRACDALVTALSRVTVLARTLATGPVRFDTRPAAALLAAQVL
jgi:hypothetical protein